MPGRMPTTVPFWCSLAATLLLLVVSLWSGLRGRRRLHLVTGPLTMVALTAAVLFTEELVRRYRFAPADLEFHLYFAKTAAGLAVAVVVTGIWLFRRPAARAWHRLAVFLFVVVAVTATGTGIWLFTRAQPV
jgi:glucan phosphoethanolaminetransferase (alkaline phosphatase superfamily)